MWIDTPRLKLRLLHGLISYHHGHFGFEKI